MYTYVYAHMHIHAWFHMYVIGHGSGASSQHTHPIATPHGSCRPWVFFCFVLICLVSPPPSLLCGQLNFLHFPACVRTRSLWGGVAFGNARIYTCIRGYIRSWWHALTHTRTGGSRYIYIHVCVYVYVCTWIHILLICIHTHIYRYIIMYTYLFLYAHV